jgi:hypothetical protein
MHAFPATHDTPPSAVLAAPAGCGVRKIRQPVPFKRSANGSATLALLV